MSKLYKYFLELILFLTYALFAMSWKAGDYLIASYGFSATQSALMTNAISSAKIIGCITASSIIIRLGIKSTFSIASLLIICGIFLPFIHEFSLIFCLRFILGLGGALVLVVINPIVAETFNSKELTTINGINSVSFNCGLAVVLALATPIKTAPQSAITIITVFSLIVLFAWLIISRFIVQPIKSTTTSYIANENYSLKDGCKEKFNWVFALSYAGVLCFYLVAFTFMSPGNIKYVIFSGIIGALIGAFGSKKIKNQLNFVRICGFFQLISAIAFLSWYDKEIAQSIGIILGFFIFLPLPVFMTLAYLRPNITPKKIAVTFSIFWSVSYFTSIIILQVFAILKDASANNFVPFIFILAAEASFFIGTTFFIKKSR